MAELDGAEELELDASELFDEHQQGTTASMALALDELAAGTDTEAGVRASDSEHAAAGDFTHRSGMTATTADGGDSDLCGGNSSLAASSSRPASSPAAAAARNVRGSRPSSAAIAAQIEGFDNDFMVPGEVPNGMLLDDVPEADAAGGYSDDEDEGGLIVDDLLNNARQEQGVLLEVNEALQRRCRAVLELRNKGRPGLGAGMSRLEGADARYRSALKQWSDLREERERVTAHYQVTVFEMKAALEGRIKRADEIAATFSRFKWEVALAAQHTKTGQPVSAKAVEALEARDRTVEEEVQRVRLKNIHLCNVLKKLEATIRDKEQLAEGLHLIDFEQLKIENQSLNEKIEEHNDELIKLRRKMTVTVQILTHMKEKLQFVEGENAALQQQLDELEASLAGRRDALSQLKSSRDRMRQKGRQLKDSSMYVTDPALLQDYEAQRTLKDELLAEIEALKQQHAAAASAAADGGAAGQLVSSARSRHSAASSSKGLSSRGRSGSASPSKAAAGSLRAGG